MLTRCSEFAVQVIQYCMMRPSNDRGLPVHGTFEEACVASSLGLSRDLELQRRLGVCALCTMPQPVAWSFPSPSHRQSFFGGLLGPDQ